MFFSSLYKNYNSEILHQEFFPQPMSIIVALYDFGQTNIQQLTHSVWESKLPGISLIAF